MVNITYMETANSLLDIIEGVNVSLNHGLGLIILGVLALLIFIVFQGYLIKQILLIDAFVCSLVSVLLVSLGWLTMVYAIIPFVFLAFMVFYNATT